MQSTLKGSQLPRKLMLSTINAFFGKVNRSKNLPGRTLGAVTLYLTWKIGLKVSMSSIIRWCFWRLGRYGFLKPVHA
jgi:hypothetical protein